MKVGLKSFFVLGTLLGSVLSVTSGVAAQGITQKQAQDILNELKQIRQLLQQQQTLLRQNTTRRAAPDQKVKLQLVDTYALGSKHAPVTLVEFTDYECPYCSKFHRTTFPQLKKNFIDTGKVRFVSRDLPLSFHKNAFQAVRAARCAGEQDKFWEMRHVLSSNPKKLSKAEISQFASELELDMAAFQSCVDSKKYEAEINKDIADANLVGITGTPGFVLGPTPEDGKFEGVRIIGAQPYAAFAARINKLLASNKKPASVKVK